jgi:4-oxalocrotonate tautomerase
VPYINVKIYEHRLDEKTEPALIERITDAVVAVFGEEMRPATWITLEPVPTHRWGIGGRPGGR